ncbi:mitochondrial fission regulator 2 isoform X2 [Rhinatrema bivittatum]|uniref:mitochondrial fission regulator 2 isoform X2 n=1 Tax=Rhinatrema bivittatum TaxID=194408 RepID=UPI00112A6AA2|nr:mitochondrial fission regulator 2 isoform X2 [Rhinatrema bivittatum]
MSLLLGLIRELLDYFGVPADRLLTQLWERYASSRSIVCAIRTHLPSTPFSRTAFQTVPLWECKEYGCTRSIVRMIGTVLPLDPCPRPHFQCTLGLDVGDYDERGILTNPVIPSLADVMWVANYEEETYTRFRNEAVVKDGERELSSPPPVPADASATPAFPGDGAVASGPLPVNAQALQKIASLECELAQLRAQIAAIVAVQETRSNNPCFDSLSSFDSPKSVLPPPSLTSTPVHHFAAPPPPPPPVPFTSLDSSSSVVDLIKQRRVAKTRSAAGEPAGKEKAACIPSMMDVLKDLSKIRLRAVERSPGGTPITKTKKRNSLSDPAALIAHALKQKFAHRKNDDDSFGKENKSFEDSSFSSPETPRFGCHLLKPTLQHSVTGAKKGRRPPAGWKKAHGEEFAPKAPAQIQTSAAGSSGACTEMNLLPTPELAAC